MHLKKSAAYRLTKTFFLAKLAPLLIPSKDVELPISLAPEQGNVSKVSFCTACMGRAHHLKRTIFKNIEDNCDYPDVEFVLLNYGSKDDMHDWVRENLRQQISDGIVSYFRAEVNGGFHCSKAKNLAHRLAGGDILVNLDADNFAGRHAAHYINHVFSEPISRVIHFARYDWRFLDVLGRIAIRREDFERVNGYREDFEPMKMQDLDLLKRCKLAGIATERVEYPNFLRSIKHSDKERKAHTIGTCAIEDMQAVNTERMEEGLKKGVFKANPEGFQRFRVQRGIDGEIFEC